MKTEISRLEETKHLFELFHLKPFDFMLSEIEEMFKKQIPNTVLKEFIVTKSPQWLTTEKTNDKDKNDGVYTRAGVAMECNLFLKSNSNKAKLKGILTWAVVNLDSKPIRQMWFDKDGTLEDFGDKGELKKRIYSIHNFS